MKTAGVIPARWASARFEGKVLAPIDGRPMIEHVWQRTRQCRRIDEVWIACDDQRVYDAACAFGAKAIMTDPKHASGTERIAEAAVKIKADIFVNIQGDEPLIDPGVIDALVRMMQEDPSCSMGTVVSRLTDPEDLNNPNVVKVVVDRDGYALYFSRVAIPFNRDKKFSTEIVYYKHIGLYAYRRDFLLNWKNFPVSQLEVAERLEQLRVLEAGGKIKVFVTEFESVGVDTPQDVKRVAARLKQGK
jgi:3-deoxy-manno-octulosonate cytidylyltransferase (CMP-KDO synthetase)